MYLTPPSENSFIIKNKKQKIHLLILINTKSIQILLLMEVEFPVV